MHIKKVNITELDILGLTTKKMQSNNLKTSIELYLTGRLALHL